MTAVEMQPSVSQAHRQAGRHTGTQGGSQLEKRLLEKSAAYFPALKCCANAAAFCIRKWLKSFISNKSFAMPTRREEKKIKKRIH